MEPQEITRRDVLKSTSATALAASGATGLLTSIAATSGADEPAAGADQKKKVRIGVVGGGFGAAFHWHEDPNCVVTGVTDLREDRRKILSERYQCDRVYDSLETMIEDARDIDAVAIFTEAPHFLGDVIPGNHLRHSRRALYAAGVNHSFN